VAPPFLTSALEGDEWSASHPCRFILGERAPGTHCIRGCWVGLRAGLGIVEKGEQSLVLPGIELGRPYPSPSLFRLSWPNLFYVVISVFGGQYKLCQLYSFLQPVFVLQTGRKRSKQ
jgi:hypothetical protein